MVLRRRFFTAFLLFLLAALAFVFVLPKILREHYSSAQVPALSIFSGKSNTPTSTPVFVPSYIKTPESVKGIYVTSWVAGRKDLRANLVKLIDETELNTIVIDIKDYSGKVAFKITSPELKDFGSEEVRIADLQDFIESLHKKGIYVIGRIAVFQDAYFVKYRPDLAVKNKAGTTVWKDRKAISWIDPGAKEYWDYIILITKESREVGFDEINFDYIRFPSDGDMKDISFPQSGTTTKPLVLKNFFEYLHDNIDEPGMKISADLFGMTTTAKDDMGIGQLFENALPYFDYVMPMVYPSHYPATFEGYKNPAAHPYEIIKIAMQEGVQRAELLASTTQSTVAELRPWLQDFDLGADYGPVEVRAQIKATYDVGLDSWILWSASNKYTRDALGR